MRLMVVFLLASAVACAQQDDVVAAARANKPQTQSASAKVYTNDDLGYGDPADNNKPEPKKGDLSKLSREKQDKTRQIIKQILQQREQVAKLQTHFDKLQQVQAERASLELTPQLTPAECTREPEQCETRRASATDLARTQKQLEAAKKKLDDLEDSARKAGYPPSVFDP